MVNETKPLPKINAVQAQDADPAGRAAGCRHPRVRREHLGRGRPRTRTRSPSTASIRISARPSRASSPPCCARTLESSGQWGAVRVVPSQRRVHRRDRHRAGSWSPRARSLLSRSRSRTPPGARGSRRSATRARRTPAPTRPMLRSKQRDPFQNVYSQIANDMVAARDLLAADSRRDIRRVTELRFAKDLAPQAMEGYLAKDQKGMMTVARLPAQDDPFIDAHRAHPRARCGRRRHCERLLRQFQRFHERLVRQLAPHELR